ncbi:DUF116 domain-containing protein [Carboxydothermus pertinax]|uniref:DUF116 domain-containing protein n=1 Tax=Carboxydothermus pertinax TaxID=870242 RepID=A0A1L8CXY2_9THEO|nr:DUF116 domain-containing protein [Carboxydothermus pertinax]GAV23724.1 hypothetical protein cpu_22340 [Carboxydothermus pertinax]
MINFYKHKIFLKSFLKLDVKKDIQKFVALVNQATLKEGPFAPEKVLVLLPHCLQKADCLYKITYDMGNCRECQRCPIGILKAFARFKRLNIAVAAGGTAARRIVQKIKPEVVLAVACEWDLFLGINDISVPAVGLLNLRPKGPCFETLVELDKLYSYINQLVW